jgi:hypothetical protein
MIGLILLENIYIFQMFLLYAKYVPRFYGITSSLKRKIGISQLYIHGFIYSCYYIIPKNSTTRYARVSPWLTIRFMQFSVVVLFSCF